IHKTQAVDAALKKLSVAKTSPGKFHGRIENRSADRCVKGQFETNTGSTRGQFWKNESGRIPRDPERFYSTGHNTERKILARIVFELTAVSTVTKSNPCTCTHDAGK